MNKSGLISEIGKLPLDEQLSLVHEVWDQIAQQNAVIPLSDAQKFELERRMAELESNPEIAIPWDVAKRQLDERRKQ